MRGLASRWLISRSVKNACRVGARSGSCEPLRDPGLQAGGDLGDQLGDRLQIPVGRVELVMLDMRVMLVLRRGSVLWPVASWG